MTIISYMMLLMLMMIIIIIIFIFVVVVAIVVIVVVSNYTKIAVVYLVFMYVQFLILDIF